MLRFSYHSFEDAFILSKVLIKKIYKKNVATAPFLVSQGTVASFTCFLQKLYSSQFLLRATKIKPKLIGKLVRKSSSIYQLLCVHSYSSQEAKVDQCVHLLLFSFPTNIVSNKVIKKYITK